VMTVIVLAVMVPLGVLVIGPKVAQHVLDTTTIALPNLTQLPCPGPYVWLHNHPEIKVPQIGQAWAGAHLQPFTQEVWTTACVKSGQLVAGALCGGDEEEFRLGTYPSPAMTVFAGKNEEAFGVTLNSNASLILSAWVSPLWYSAQKTHLILKAEQVTVKVLGIPFSGLTMRNELTCTGVPVNLTNPPLQIPNSVCYPNDPKHDPYSTQALMAVCEAGRKDIAVPTTTTHKSLATTTTAKESSLLIV